MSPALCLKCQETVINKWALKSFIRIITQCSEPQSQPDHATFQVLTTGQCTYVWMCECLVLLCILYLCKRFPSRSNIPLDLFQSSLLFSLQMWNKMSFFFGNMATGRFPTSTSNSFAQRNKNWQERGHQVGRGICCGYHRRSLRVEWEGALKSLDTSNSRILKE